MADQINEQILNECIDKALNNIKKDHKDIDIAVKRLLEGRDVLAILPTALNE